MIDYLKDKTKYIKEPYRLRVYFGYILIIIFSFNANPSYTRFYIGTAGVFLGIIIRAWASGIVKKDESLAVEGPYSLCRNPLYVGNILIGYSFVIFQGELWSLIALTAYLLLFYPMTIRFEEQKMENLFGDEFNRYRREVPLLMPRLTPYETLRGWSFYQYFVENKDVVNEGLVLVFWAYCGYQLFLG
jgi:protein-S-isoprenylcysteine O-methyltransferase Ste14